MAPEGVPTDVVVEATSLPAMFKTRMTGRLQVRRFPLEILSFHADSFSCTCALRNSCDIFSRCLNQRLFRSASIAGVCAASVS